MMITKNDYDYDYSQRKLIKITIMIAKPRLHASIKSPVIAYQFSVLLFNIILNKSYVLNNMIMITQKM